MNIANMKQLSLLIMASAIVGAIDVQGVQNGERASEIRGQVVDAETGDPLDGVTVGLRETGVGFPADSAFGRLLGSSFQDAVVTEPDGRFVLPLPESPGPHVLAVIKPGYVSGRQEGHRLPERRSAAVDLSAGIVLAPDQTEIRVALQRSGLVVGKVLDHQGVAVANAEVEAFRFAYDDWGSPIVKRLAGGSTNDRGEFRFEADPAEYRFVVRPPYGDRTAYYPTYYPSARSPEQASVVAVESGGETNLGTLLLLPAASGGRLRLRISDETGVPRTPSVEVGAGAGHFPLFSSLSGQNTTEQQRVFEVDAGWLPQGSYLAGVSQGSVLSRIAVPVEVGNSDVEYEITLPKATELRARAMLIDGDAEPVPVERVTLRFAFDWPIEAALYIFRTSLADGRFTQPLLGAVQYRVRVDSVPEGLYVDRVMSGDLDVLKTGLRVAGDVVDLDVILGRASARVSGVVHDERGNPVSTAVVVAIPNDPAEIARYARMEVDPGGRFSAQIPPGRYRLYAWRELEGAAYLNEDFMRRYIADGADIDASANGELHVSVTVLE